ncbi:MAG: UDP-N-acetylmuramate dehydrogenase [Oscillospiraceae bacterium]|nr:UDP-N-acetylmuramate dehydrogenase [Oscillospiraceae bacterium]
MDATGYAIEHIRKALPGIRCLTGEMMKDHTSFKIGGPVRAMYFPESADAVSSLCEALSRFDACSLIIGNGTNMLFDDGRHDVAVIKMTGVSGVERSGATGLKAGAGVSLSALAAAACRAGLAGLEFAHGIPGTLGGALAMNAGAYGNEMKDVVESTTVFRPGFGAEEIPKAGHGFAYRSSRFSTGDETVLSSVIRLEPGEVSQISAGMDELGRRRSGSQPLDYPSAGSVFKRPASGYAAELIEKSGLKGYAFGGAQVSEKHAGFIINRGGAAFADVMEVMEHIRETVFRQFGVELEPEIKIVRSS